MKKILKATCALMVASIFLASCGSTSNVEGSETKTESKKDSKKAKKVKFDQAAYDAAYAKGDYETCIEMLDARESDLILTELDSSMLQFMKKDYMASAKEFVQTQQDMQAVSNDMTVGKTMEAALLGENSVNYSGATYERILAYSMKAVNALKMGEIDRAVGVMNEYTGNYKDEISAVVQQQKEVAAQSEGVLENEEVKTSLEAMKKIGIDVGLDKFTSAAPKASSAIYENSAFLSYLGTLIYAANNDSVHANDFASVLKTMNTNVDVSEDLAVLAGKGRIDVIALSDVIGKKSDAKTNYVPVGNLGAVTINFKMAYPAFEKQNHAIQVSKVTLSNGESKPFTLVEDFDEAVKIDVASKAKGAYNRSIFRNVVKNSAAVVAGYATLETAKKSLEKAGSNPLAAKAAQAAYEKAVQGVNTALIAVVDAEKSDIRQGAYFPHKASAAGFTVTPGTYTATVEYSNGITDVIENIVVEAGKPTVVISEKINSVK